MNEQQYYIISYQYSRNNNGHICFWRPNNAGYTNDLLQAGKYSESEVKACMNYYHQGDNAVAVPVEEIERDFKIRHHVEIDHKARAKHLRRATLGILKPTNCANHPTVVVSKPEPGVLLFDPVNPLEP